MLYWLLSLCAPSSQSWLRSMDSLWLLFLTRVSQSIACVASVYKSPSSEPMFAKRKDCKTIKMFVYVSTSLHSYRVSLKANGDRTSPCDSFIETERRLLGRGNWLIQANVYIYSNSLHLYCCTSDLERFLEWTHSSHQEDESQGRPLLFSNCSGDIPQGVPSPTVSEVEVT